MLNTPVSIEFAGAAAEFTDRTSFIDGVKIVAPVGCVAGTRGAGAVTIAASPGTVVAVPVIIVIPQSGGCRDRLAIRPLVAVAEEGEGGDAVVPVPIAFASHGDPMQIVYVVVNKEAGTAKIGIVEDAKAGFAEDADGSDSVIESGRHGGPALASLETKEIPTKIMIPIEAGTRPRWMRAAPTPLGEGWQRSGEKQKDGNRRKTQSHGSPLNTLI